MVWVGAAPLDGLWLAQGLSTAVSGSVIALTQLPHISS